MECRSSSVASSPFLDWKERPQSIQKDISSAFDVLSSQNVSGWGAYNGQEKYEIAQVDEHKLMAKIIKKSPNRKEFFALDIGAGNFHWGKSLADYLEAQNDLEESVKVHIFSIRGEKYSGENIIEGKRCKNYNFGAFKVEELFNEFKRNGIDLENKIDLLVSRWSFRHLVDPVGTFAQAYNLLRPKEGFLFIDGFMFLNQDDDLLTRDNNARMTQLFIDTKAPFLTRDYFSGHSLKHFVLQRLDETPCQLPMKYLGTETVDGRGWQIGSNRISLFEREPQELDQEGFYSSESIYTVLGNKKIFDCLKRNRLFSNFTEWQPLQVKDSL